MAVRERPETRAFEMCFPHSTEHNISLNLSSWNTSIAIDFS